MFDISIADSRAKINDLNRKLHRSLPNKSICLVVTNEGLPLDTIAPDHIDEINLWSWTSSLRKLSERMLSYTEGGILQEVTIKGEDYLYALIQINADVIIAVATEDIKIGLVLFEMRETASKLEKILREII